MRGRAKLAGERLWTQPSDDRTTPHPTRYARHLLPQGEKDNKDGIREEVTLRAIKRVIALQLQQEAGTSPLPPDIPDEA